MELNEAITLIDDELFHSIDLLYKEPQDKEVIDKIRNAWAVIILASHNGDAASIEERFWY